MFNHAKNNATIAAVLLFSAVLLTGISILPPMQKTAHATPATEQTINQVATQIADANAPSAPVSQTIN
jgi:outer membrane murein-binding lipoprotein Lpp